MNLRGSLQPHLDKILSVIELPACEHEVLREGPLLREPVPALADVRETLLHVRSTHRLDAEQDSPEEVPLDVEKFIQDNIR